MVGLKGEPKRTRLPWSKLKPLAPDVQLHPRNPPWLGGFPSKNAQSPKLFAFLIRIVTGHWSQGRALDGADPRFVPLKEFYEMQDAETKARSCAQSAARAGSLPCLVASSRITGPLAGLFARIAELEIYFTTKQRIAKEQMRDWFHGSMCLDRGTF